MTRKKAEIRFIAYLFIFLSSAIATIAGYHTEIYGGVRWINIPTSIALYASLIGMFFSYIAILDNQTHLHRKDNRNDPASSS